DTPSPVLEMRRQRRHAPMFLLTIEAPNGDRFTQTARNELPIGAVEAAVVTRRRSVHRWLHTRFAANHAPGPAAVVRCKRFDLLPGNVVRRGFGRIRKLDLTLLRTLEGHAHRIAVRHGVAR